MMNIGDDNRLIVEDSDGLNFRFVPSPNVKPGGIKYQYLVIHGTEGQNVDGAIATFQDEESKTSIHLILGRDGKELVQMVEFDRRAQHANEYNAKALGIELDYTGPLNEDPGNQHLFNHISKFQPGEYIYAIGLNDRDGLKTVRPWPRFPKAQIEALIPITRLLVERFDLQIVGHEEIKNFKFDPGPAFPMVRFKEIIHDTAGGSILYDELDKDVELRAGPGMVFDLLPGGKIDSGAAVSVSYVQNSWALVEVMDETEGGEWLVGWTPLDTIKARHATPVVKDHKLFTTNGLQYQFITPHPNNFDADRRLIGPKYLIIHTTDGIVMESTINSFRNGNHGASAHLLVGRDGGVVQFVDFNTVAYHCGFSYWEGEIDLNQFSIGIEVDNGGFLSHADGVWKWKTTIIPDDEVTQVRYWKNTGKLGWHKFTDIQLKVLREIVQALKEHYDLQVVLGHDVINLAERVDPGPLFPRGEFEQLVSGKPGVVVKVYQATGDKDHNGNVIANGETQIYAVREKKPPYTEYPRPPDLDHPRHGVLPAKSRVNILDTSNLDWTRVKVKAVSGPFKNTEGWIRSDAVNPALAKPKTKKDSEYFKLNPHLTSRAPWSFLKQNPLPLGTRLRVERFEDNFALVATLEPVLKGYLEGWVEKASISLVGEEQIVYPPLPVF
jgi:N-acetyl-anhydromuramyl-L-alanine amidase AmpD